MRLLRILLCTLIGVLWFGGVASAQGWAKRYNGTGNGPDAGYAITSDQNGNSYVTGRTYTNFSQWHDLVVIKYAPNGKLVWQKKYNGPASGSDSGYAITLDSAGNVYVTGTSDGGNTGYDIVTLKFDNAGNQLWAKRYNGLGKGWDFGYYIAVDGAGNVYVTGDSDGRLATDIVTLKYDTDGKLLWSKRYDGPVSGYDYSSGVAVDASGNVFTVGTSRGTDATYYDIALIKYSPAGKQLWVRRFDGAGNSFDYASGVAIDASGNAIVLGSTYSGFDTGLDITVLKYDTTGKLLWSTLSDDAEGGDDYSYGLALDSVGNIYVTGSQNTRANGDDIVTLKLDSSGAVQWTQTVNSNDSGYDAGVAITVDSAGNVYVAGALDSGSVAGDDIITLKYDKDGNLLRSLVYNGHASSSDQPYAISVNGAGNIFVTGRTYGGLVTGYDIITLMYTP